MKKTITTMSALLLLSATLAACNTDTTEPATTAAKEDSQLEQSETTTQSNTEQTTEQQKSEKVEENNTPAQANSQQAKETNTLTYRSNGEEFTYETKASTSEEMNYTIAHFDNYSLVAEDPGIDQLINNDDDRLTMQIEVTTKEDVVFDDVKASALEALSAVSPNITELNLTSILENHSDISNIVGYETILDETDKVVKIVFERDNLFATLTIYDTVTADLQDAFLQMGLTIQ